MTVPQTQEAVALTKATAQALSVGFFKGQDSCVPWECCHFWYISATRHTSVWPPSAPGLGPCESRTGSRARAPRGGVGLPSKTLPRHLGLCPCAYCRAHQPTLQHQSLRRPCHATLAPGDGAVTPVTPRGHGEEARHSHIPQGWLQRGSPGLSGKAVLSPGSGTSHPKPAGTEREEQDIPGAEGHLGTGGHCWVVMPLPGLLSRTQGMGLEGLGTLKEILFARTPSISTATVIPP